MTTLSAKFYDKKWNQNAKFRNLFFERNNRVFQIRHPNASPFLSLPSPRRCCSDSLDRWRPAASGCRAHPMENADTPDISDNPDLLSIAFVCFDVRMCFFTSETPSVATEKLQQQFVHLAILCELSSLPCTFKKGYFSLSMSLKTHLRFILAEAIRTAIIRVLFVFLFLFFVVHT